MRKASLTTAILIIVASSLCMAVELPQGVLETEIQTIKNTPTSADDFFAQDGDEFDEFATDEESIYSYEYKSPKKAFLMSLLVPGWGQYYNRSNPIKLIGMFAVEIGSWVGYFKFHNDGNKMTDEYEDYADLHWIEGDRGDSLDLGNDQTYWDWYYSYAIFDNGDNLVPGNETLPDERTQQYYEMIGKYDQFAGGWDDYWTENLQAKWDDTGAVVMTPHRRTYENMRDKANDKLNQANNFILLAMANHLISAFDAALAANRFNKNNSGDNWLSIRAEMRKYSATDEIPIVRLTYHF